MTPFNLPLDLTKGITFGPVIFNFKDTDGTTPFDLTGWKVFAYARRNKNDTFKIDLAPTITDAAQGQVRIAFTDEEVLAQTAGNYTWDMVLENPAGERLGPYFAGPYNVTEINTHA
jgi:hypothetical protein